MARAFADLLTDDGTPLRALVEGTVPGAAAAAWLGPQTRAAGAAVTAVLLLAGVSLVLALMRSVARLPRDSQGGLAGQGVAHTS